jgi:hypothetical protein
MQNKNNILQTMLLSPVVCTKKKKKKKNVKKEENPIIFEMKISILLFDESFNDGYDVCGFARVCILNE